MLYVGKAKNLKKRTSSYTQTQRLSDRIALMTKRATQLRFLRLSSELEALLTEAELIKTYQPQFNILLKDDKSPLYIVVEKAMFPRILRVRKKELKISQRPAHTIIGPFNTGYKVGEVLRIARRIFPWCDSPESGRACFYYHIQRCPGACIGAVDAETYQESIRNLVLFLRGKKSEVIAQLTQEMLAAAEDEQFERAAVRKNQIALIEEVMSHRFRLKPQLTTPALREKLHADGVMYLRRILSQHGLVGREFQLKRIEGYDVSNISGTNATVAQVVFIDGRPSSKDYRIYHIKNLNTPNDYQMMKQAIARRQNHPEWDAPQLLVVDGGRGQVRAALSVWESDTPIIGIAKNPDRLILPNMRESGPNYFEIRLPDDHPGLRLVQAIRDEAHRFSRKHHRKRRMKEFLL